MADATHNIFTVFAEFRPMKRIDVTASTCEINYIANRRRKIFFNRLGNRLCPLHLGTVHIAACYIRFCDCIAGKKTVLGRFPAGINALLNKFALLFQGFFAADLNHSEVIFTRCGRCITAKPYIHSVRRNGNFSRLSDIVIGSVGKLNCCAFVCCVINRSHRKEISVRSFGSEIYPCHCARNNKYQRKASNKRFYS